MAFDYKSDPGSIEQISDASVTESELTHKKGNRLDLILGCSFVSSHVERIGILDSNYGVESDHAALYVDLSKKIFCKQKDPTAPSVRGVRITDKKRTAKFRKRVKKALTSSRTLEQLDAAIAATSHSVLIKHLCNSIDEILTATVLDIEDRVRCRSQHAPPCGFAVLGLIAMIMILCASCCAGLQPCHMTAAAVLSYVGAILGVVVGVAILLTDAACQGDYYYYSRGGLDCRERSQVALIMACLGAPFLIAGGVLSNMIACRMAREAQGNPASQKPTNTTPAQAEAVLLNNSSVTVRETMDPDGKKRVEKTTTDEHGNKTVVVTVSSMDVEEGSETN